MARLMGGCRGGAFRVILAMMRPRCTGSGSTRPFPLVLLGLGAIVCLPSVAVAGPLARSLDYLAARQDRTGGGFAAAGGTEPGYTAWASLAVSAAGEDPRLWQRGKLSLRKALRAPLVAPTVGDIERQAVAIAAAGMDPRVVGGRNLMREVLRAQSTDGTIGPDTSTTAWGVLALRAGGLGPTSQSVNLGCAALQQTQQRDGGWSLTEMDPRSGPNTTSSVVQALVACGHRPESSVYLRRARAFLISTQNADGGFPPAAGGPSTALTTAWVALAVRALGERPSEAPWNLSGGPLVFLASLQRADGGVRNAAESKVPSVWATSQAALAFGGKYLPYSRQVARPVPLRSPRVVARRPVIGGRLRGPLTIAYRDDNGGTGVDRSSVRLRVGGRDLTRRATVTSRLLLLPRRYVPGGRVAVQLSFADRAGNGRTVRWAVIAPGR